MSGGQGITFTYAAAAGLYRPEYRCEIMPVKAKRYDGRGNFMALAQAKIYTEEDYYNIPEEVRAELIDGQIYYHTAPGLIHQIISGELYTAINIYLKSKKGRCRVFSAPFAVKLFEDRKNVVEPDISVICEPDKLNAQGCTGAYPAGIQAP